MKRCRTCKQSKPLSEYSRWNKTEDGLYPDCETCCEKHQKAAELESMEHRMQQKIRQQPLGKRLAQCFYSMRARCNNPYNQAYGYYGAKGVECRFEDADDFICYVISVLGFNSYDKICGLEIHRINNGHYEMGGIEFLTPTGHRARHDAIREKTERDGIKKYCIMAGKGIKRLKEVHQKFHPRA